MNFPNISFTLLSPFVSTSALKSKMSLSLFSSMGSFTSMPKKIPAPDADDDDVYYPENAEDLRTLLDRCSKQLMSLPPPIERSWTKLEEEVDEANSGEKVRVLQWNVLSQGEYKD